MTAAVAWLWQGLLLTAIVELLLRAMPRLNAATRHLVWWAALAGLFLLAAVHASGQPGEAPAAASFAPAAPAGDLLFSFPAAPGWLIGLVAAAWAGLALGGFARVIGGLRHVAALRRHAAPLSARDAARLARWTTTREAARTADVCVTAAPVGACALGFRRPAILISRQLLATLDDDRLAQVVLHEQAHLDRYDDWLRVVQTLAVAALAIHPAAHLVGRRIDLEREAACDDRVVSVTGAARDYAACLTEAAAATSPTFAALASSALGAARPSAGLLRTRIVRLLDSRPDRGRRLVRPVLAAAVASIAGILAAAPVMPSLIVFVENAAPPGRVDDARRAGPAARPPATRPASESAVTVAVASSARAETGTPSRNVRRPSPSREQPTPVASVPPPAKTVVAQEPGAGPVVTAAEDALVSPSHEVPAETLGGLGLVVSEAPPVYPVAVASPPPASAAGNRSLLGGVSQFGRNSAATARKAGESVAGTFARAGKAIGKFF